MNFAVILSGGTGSRMKGAQEPKQYLKVGGRMVISYCLEVLFETPCLDAFVVVADQFWQPCIKEEISRLLSGREMRQKGRKASVDGKTAQPDRKSIVDVETIQPNGHVSVDGETARLERKSFVDGKTIQPDRNIYLNRKIAPRFLGFVHPGDNRQISVFHALRFLKEFADDRDFVLIHDAARPLVTVRQLTDCICAAQKADGCVPVLPMKDTVYYSRSGGRIESLLKRECVFAGQAPEAFVFGKYYRANERLDYEEMLAVNGSTEPAVMAGMDIMVIPGEEGNFKITTVEDLGRFEQKIKVTVQTSTLH